MGLSGRANQLQIQLLHLLPRPRRAAQKLQAGLDAGVEREAADRHRICHCLPTHLLRELGDDHLKGDAFQGGALRRFVIGFHARILPLFGRDYGHDEYVTPDYETRHARSLSPTPLRAPRLALHSQPTPAAGSMLPETPPTSRKRAMGQTHRGASFTLAFTMRLLVYVAIPP